MNSRILVIRFWKTTWFNYVQPHLERVRHSCSTVVSHLFHRYCCLVDTCQGDSGGPLMVFTDLKQWELVGITSYGYGCATEHPGVYTRITAFLTWIQQFVQEGKCRHPAPKKYRQVLSRCRIGPPCPKSCRSSSFLLRPSVVTRSRGWKPVNRTTLFRSYLRLSESVIFLDQPRILDILSLPFWMTTTFAWTTIEF